MVQSLELALKQALNVGSRTATHSPAPRPELKQTVLDWSADDTVHVDPPIHNADKKEDEMAFASETTTRNDAPESAPASAPSKSLTQLAFEFIRDNPGRPRTDVVRALADMGYKSGSVSSLVGQMQAQRLVYRDDTTGGMFTNRRDFVPLKSGAVREALAKAYRLEQELKNPGRAKSYEKMVRTRRRRQAQAASQGNEGKPAVKPEYNKLESLAKARAVLAEKRAAKKKKPADKSVQRVKLTDKRQLPAAKALNDIVRNVDLKPMPMPVPGTASDPRENMPAAAALNLRGVSAEDVVHALSIVQAKEVYEALARFFAKP